jgi:hypothetical protein
LYRGRKAIVQQDNWIDSLTFLHPHIKRIGTWSKTEMAEALETPLSDFNPSDIPELWMPYWKNFVNNFKN